MIVNVLGANRHEGTTRKNLHYCMSKFGILLAIHRRTVMGAIKQKHGASTKLITRALESVVSRPADQDLVAMLQCQNSRR